MLLRLLPFLGGVIPVLAATLAYWLSAHHGALPSCNPWLDGCTSISAAGRYPPGSYLFRAVQLPYAAVIVVIWFFSREWLRTLCGDQQRQRIRVMYVSGVLAAVALIVYVTFLGTGEPIYQFMRRFGIYAYFLGTVVAQLMLSITLAVYAGNSGAVELRRISRHMVVLAALPFVFGILNLVLKTTLDDAAAAQNRIEWIATLLMQAWFVLLYLAWRQTGFKAVVQVAVLSRSESSSSPSPSEPSV
jgi:hypothetical protein